MKATSLIAVFVSVMIVFAGFYTVSVARQPADLLIIQSTSASLAPVRWIAERMLGRLDHCPVEDFHPTTPIGFVISAWEQTNNSGRSIRLLELLVARGCDIDSYGGRGLAPLHSAVLFNNLDAVVVLLRLGADRNLTTVIPKGKGYKEISFDALSFAEYLDSVSGEDRSAVIAVLN